MRLLASTSLPSTYSLLVILTITLLSLFGRQLFEQIVPLLGRSGIEFATLTTLLVLLFVLRLYRIWWQLLILLTALAVARYFFIAEELVHIIFFGTLGFSLQRDGRRGRSHLSMGIIGLAVCAGDELLQHFLPWRFGDLRDVVLNSVAFGSSFFYFRFSDR